MVHIGQWKDSPVVISHKPNSITFSVERKSGTDVFSFDMEHRLWTALKDGISYRRGLNGNIVAKWRSGNEVLHRKWLTQDEIGSLLNYAHKSIHDFLKENKSSFHTYTPEISSELQDILHAISQINLDFYMKNMNRYNEVYLPVGILPPDQYISVVLQATEGCSFNTCTFCDFYKNRRFKIKSTEEFSEHIRQVKDFIGKGINLRRTIFLGDANALVTPTKRLLPMLEEVNKQLDVEALGGIYAFLDGFSGEKKTAKDYSQFKALGMEKVYIGMESGDEKLLRFLNKPGSAKDVLKAVQEIKKGGLSVGVIILLGAGGKQFARSHIKNTIKEINRMELDADDLIYFSELIENDEMTYSKYALQANIKPLLPEERWQQAEIMQRKFKFYENDVPHISRYDIRDFVY